MGWGFRLGKNNMSKTKAKECFPKMQSQKIFKSSATRCKVQPSKASLKILCSWENITKHDKDPLGIHLVKPWHRAFIHGILKNTPNFIRY